MVLKTSVQQHCYLGTGYFYNEKYIFTVHLKNIIFENIVKRDGEYGKSK